MLIPHISLEYCDTRRRGCTTLKVFVGVTFNNGGLPRPLTAGIVGVPDRQVQLLY